MITDQFTHFAPAYANTTKSGKTAAKLIINDDSLKFGFPCHIHHDQGGEFENQFISQLKKLCGMVGSRTTPYHLVGNGLVKHMNTTLLQMLRTITETQRSNWKESINKLIMNITAHVVKLLAIPHFICCLDDPPDYQYTCPLDYTILKHVPVITEAMWINGKWGWKKRSPLQMRIEGKLSARTKDIMTYE